MHEILDYLLGDFKQKKEILPSCNLEVLNLLINDLSKLKYNTHDHKNCISALDLWETSVENPNFSIEHLKILFPLIFRVQGYPVRYLNRKEPKEFVDTLLTKNLPDEEVFQLLKNILSEKIEPLGPTNKNLNIFIQKIFQNKKYIKTNIFLKNRGQEQLKNTPSSKLINLKSPYRRKIYFDSLYCPPISLNDLNLEIKARKHKTPPSWKNYKTADFMDLLNNLKTKLTKIKHTRKGFFKNLKNRMLSEQEINQATLDYLSQLTELENLIQKQKQEVLERIKDLPVQDKPITPDSSSASDPQRT